MEPADRDLLERIAAHAQGACAGHDPAHDVVHLQRVVANARRILDGEEFPETACDAFVVLAACWLHDLVQLPKGSSPPGEAARRSAGAARSFLTTLDVDERRIGRICNAVTTHSFSGGEPPASIEAAIVQDADRLDALGAIGIARLWVIAAARRSMLYDPNDPLARERPLDDGRFALDHVATKLLTLPDLMHTDTARRLARERADYLLAYRDQLLREVGKRGRQGDR